MSWACQIHRSSEQQLEGFDGLTVGEVFRLACSGEAVEGLLSDSVTLVVTKENPYDFKILQIQKINPEGAELLMTTYGAPRESLGPLTLTDGQQEWQLEIAPVQVASVLPQEGSEEVIPYGPYGPFVLSFPLWLYLFILPVLAIIVWAATLLIRRVRRSRKIQDALKEAKGVLSPVENFHKSQRQIIKNLFVFRSGEPEQRRQALDKIRTSLNQYLLQEFQAMGTEEGLQGAEKKAVQKSLKPAVAKPLVSQLQMVFTEMKRAEEDAAKVDFEQAEKLVEMTRELVVKLSQSKRSKARGVA